MTRAATCGSCTTWASGSAQRLAGSTDERDRPVLDLTWDYPTAGCAGRADRRGRARRDQRLGRRRRNPLSLVRGAEGRRHHVLRLLDLLRRLQGRRQPGRAAQAGQGADLGLVRVGLGMAGQPAHPLQPGVGRPRRKPLERKESTGLVGRGRRASGPVTTSRTSRRPSLRTTDRPTTRTGVDAISGIDPFILQSDGKGWLYTPVGLVDGPMPTHYEPQESPFDNLLYGQQSNPVRRAVESRHNRYAPRGSEPGSDVYPYVVTTYRVTEHFTAGGMSRWLPYLAELQPAMFVEVSPELAAERKLENAGWATIVTAARGDRGPGPGDRPDVPTHRRRTDDAPDRDALPLGAQRGHHRRRVQRAVVDLPRPQRAHPGGQGAGGRHPARAAGREAPHGCATSRASSNAPASRPRPARRPDMSDVARCCRPSRRRPRGWASSPTPASASAARPAKSRARSGTRSPRTASTSPGCRTTTRSASAPTPGGT